MHSQRCYNNSGKVVVGIDPARKNHQAAIIDSDGISMCKPSRFKPDYPGFNKLFQQLSILQVKINPKYALMVASNVATSI
ncbi:MAG: hypothetical protein ACE5IR_05290 [bacterium]